MNDSNNQNADATSAAVADKPAVVTTSEAEVKIPSPKVVSHISEMVEQHAAIREAKLKKLAQEAQKQQAQADSAPKQGAESAPQIVRAKEGQDKGEKDSSSQAADSTVETQETEVAEANESSNASEDDSTRLSPKAEKRIGKLTARAKSAEERVAELEGKLKQLEQKAEAPKQPSTFEREVTEEEAKSWGEYAKETDVAKLQTEYKKLVNFRDEISDILDIGAVRTDESGKEYLMELGGQKMDKAQLVSLRRELNKRVNEAIPSRIRAVQEVQQYKRQADSFIPQWVPEVLDKNSDVYQEVEAIRQSRFGWVLNEAPQAELYITLGIKAAKEMLAKAQANSTTEKPPVKIPDKPIRATPRANIPTTAGPSMTTEVVSEEHKKEYERLKAKARVTQNEMDMAAAMSYRQKYKIK